MINWKNITTENDLNEIKSISKAHPVVIFKHSTRCSISASAKDRLERNWHQDQVPNVNIYFLDLLQYRNISDAIATQFQVEHQSPQIILIKNEKAFYSNSHMGISFADIKEHLQ